MLALSVGRTVKDAAAPFQESTEPVKIADLVNLCACEERQLQRELLGLVQRGVIRCEKSGKGEYILTPLFRIWGQLQTYKPGPTPEPGPDEDESGSEDEAAKQGTLVKLTEKPVPVRAGGASRKIKVETGISEIWCKSNVDIHFEAVIQSGCLLVNFIGPQFQAGAGNGSLNQKEIQTGTRHARRVEHPRAAEVERLFDPLLLAVRGGRSLSGDAACFREACEALGDTDHDFFVHYVQVRAKRDISTPKAAVAICRDVARDWEKSKNLPTPKRDPRNLTREDIDALIAADEARALAKRRRA